MGRTSISGLDPDCIFSISRNGYGKVALYERNDRPCICAECRKAVDTSRGARFRKARFHEGRSGFLCGECVAKMLADTPTWNWNKHFYILHPAVDWPASPFLGRELAEVWSEQGLSGLVFLLKRQPNLALAAETLA